MNYFFQFKNNLILSSKYNEVSRTQTSLFCISLKHLQTEQETNGSADGTWTIVGRAATGLEEVVEPLASSADIASSSSSL